MLIKLSLKAGSKIKFENIGDQVKGGSQYIYSIIKEVSFDRISWLRANELIISLKKVPILLLTLRKLLRAPESNSLHC